METWKLIGTNKDMSEHVVNFLPYQTWKIFSYISQMMQFKKTVKIMANINPEIKFLTHNFNDICKTR
jgi:hypothetical protein